MKMTCNIHRFMTHYILLKGRGGQEKKTMTKIKKVKY